MITRYKVLAQDDRKYNVEFIANGITCDDVMVQVSSVDSNKVRQFTMDYLLARLVPDWLEDPS